MHDPIERFMAKVDRRGPDECWPWMGCCSSGGYGAFSVGTKDISAHVFSFQTFVGPVPENSTVDHTCHTRDKSCPGGKCGHRKCVNPAHLEPVPRGVNTLRGKTLSAANKAKTHCSKGHPYSEENTYRWGNVRVCKTCHKAKTAAQQRARKRRASGLTELGNAA